MPQKDLVQIGLRLDATVLERLDKHASTMGLDRTSVIRLSIIRFMEGSEPAPGSSGGAVVDQPARDGLTKLAAKVNLLGAVQVKHQERLNALEARKAEPVPAPFELDI